MSGLQSFLHSMGFTQAQPAQQEPGEQNPTVQQEQQQVQQQTRQTEQSDLDVFQQMRDTALGKKPELAPEFSLDPATLNDAASKLNFTQGISPELMQKAMGGDTEAFMQVLNQTNQNTFKTAVSTIGKLNGEHTKQALTHQAQSLKSEFASTMATSGINLDAHPVVKQQVIENAKLLASQFPNASPEQIRQQALEITAESARNLMKAMGMEVVDPKNPQNGQKVTQAAGEVDWENEFNNM